MDLPPASPAGEADGHGDPERHAAPPAAPAARRPRGHAADTSGWHTADAGSAALLHFRGASAASDEKMRSTSISQEVRVRKCSGLSNKL